MSLQKIRENNNISRKELAELTGISYRSIQDYEQGHKKLSSAKANTLYKLSLALGCSVEDLIEDELVNINKPAKGYPLEGLTIAEIENESIFLKDHNINAKWKFINKACYIEFIYKGSIVILPFNAIFTSNTIKWLKDAVELIVEEYIEDIEFNEKYSNFGEALWDEQ